MADLANTAEGTSGAAIPGTAIGGPDAFATSTVTGTGTAATFDNAHVHSGSTSIKHHLATVASTCTEVWTTGISPSPTANAFCRFYLYVTAVPSAPNRLIGLYTGASVTCSLQYTTAGALRILNSAGATVGTMAATVPLNQWVRVEFEATGIVGTTGNMAARMFSGANLETSTPDTNGSLAFTAQTVVGTVDGVRWGQSGSVTHTTAFDLWHDDYAFSTAATPGPLRYPVLPYRPPTPVMRAAGW